jgi:hypothetical protein
MPLIKLLKAESSFLTPIVRRRTKERLARLPESLKNSFESKYSLLTSIASGPRQLDRLNSVNETFQTAPLLSSRGFQFMEVSQHPKRS